MKLANERKLVKNSNPDPYFLVPKALYFLLNWLVYSPHTYFLQFQQVMWDFNLEQLNLAFIFQIFNFFGAMYWGALADRTRKYKSIATLCVIVNTIFVSAMVFPMFTGNLKLAYFFFLTAGQCFFSAGTFPMIDAIVLSILESDPNAGKDYYGSQKAFGTIAHNITAIVIHISYDYFGQDFLVMYYSAVVSMIALVSALLYGVPDALKIKAHKHHGPAKTKEVKEEEPVPEGSSTFGLLKKPSFLFFLASILASGIVRSVNTNNHSIYLTEYLKLEKSVVANLMLIRLVPELGLLFFAKTLMGYFGPYWFLIIGQFAGVLRISLYFFLKPYVSYEFPYNYLLFFMEMLKGANSSMVSASAFCIASDLAPRAWSGAAQTLVAGVWQGVSMTSAAIIAYLVLFLTSSKVDVVSTSDDSNLFYLFLFTSVIGAISFVAIFFHYSVTNPVLFKKKQK